jgi:hypothetical protein
MQSPEVSAAVMIGFGVVFCSVALWKDLKGYPGISGYHFGPPRKEYPIPLLLRVLFFLVGAIFVVGGVSRMVVLMR